MWRMATRLDNAGLNHKVPIFYEYLLLKNTLKLRKIIQICLRSFVNTHLGEYSQNFLRQLRNFFVALRCFYGVVTHRK